MVWFLFFWISLLSSGDISKAQTESDVINVGAIFSFGSINGRVSKVAMKAAEDDINSDATVLGGRKLFISMHDSNYSGFLGIIGALQFMETDTVAIIGPQTSGMAHILSHIGNQLHIPLLSFTALDPTLSPLQYPYFIQTAPNDLFQMTAIAEMVSYYGWGEVIAMFTDDDNSRNSVAALGDQLSGRRCKISYKSPLPPDTSVTRSGVMAELEKIKMMESRVIVLHTFSKTGLLVFEVAKEVGMMEQGYVWFASAWLSTVLDSTGPLSAKTASSISGVITVRPHTPDSEQKAKFVSRWKELSNGSVGVNPYALYAYDTVWVIAWAVKQFLDQGNNISFSDDPSLTGIGFGALNLKALSMFNGGTQVLTNILETNMTGLTGPFKFNSDRAIRRPSFDIINILENGYREIGFWSNYSGLSVVSPEVLYAKPANRSSASQHLSNVVWPGGTQTQPRGWFFPDNGRKLRIGVPNRVSYRAFVEEVNSTDRARGYCIDVFVAAVKLLPYSVPFEFIPFGDGHKNPSYNEFVNMIVTGVFDAAIGDIAIVTNRTRIADFTQPYAESGLVVVAPVKKMNSNAWAFLRPFTGGMWAVTAAFFLIVGTVIWILEHRINDEFRGPPRDQVVTVLWFSFSTMFFAHRESLMSTLGRMVLIVWLFVILVINSSYTASLTSILTVQQLSSPITGIDSLIMSSSLVGYQVGSYAEDYMMEELNIPKSRLVALGSPEEYAAALSNGTVAAVVDERPYVDLFLTKYCHFKIRGDQFTRSGWGFAFPRDSPLAVDMSTAILALSENGDLQKIHDRWLWKKSCGVQSSGDDSVQLRIQSFWGLFLICGIACFLALLAYFFSTFRKFSRHAETEPSPERSSKSARIQTFLSFVDEKEDRSKSRLKRKRRDESPSMNGVNTPARRFERSEETRNGVAWDH